MASSMIHIAVCNELNKKLKRDNSKILIGTIAPDISKLVGESKVYTHFLDSKDTDIPNIGKFLAKYMDSLNDDFVLGYYIHLYTDYLWFKYFIPEIYDKEKNLITKLDGTVVNCKGEMAIMYIYNDYTNINSEIVKRYNLNINFLYAKLPKMESIIDEIDMNKISLIVNKTRQIYENSKVHKDMVFNMDNVDEFIKLSTELIMANLEEIKTI